MINGKPLILLICGRQIISKWSKKSSREAICRRRAPQFVVTSRDATGRTRSRHRDVITLLTWPNILLNASFIQACQIAAKKYCASFMGAW